VTALGFGVAAARLGWSVELPVVLALIAGVVAASAVDIAYLRIPTPFLRVTGAVILVCMVAAALAGTGPEVEAAGGSDLTGPVMTTAGPGALVGALVGGAFYAGFLLVFHLISPASLGYGDVRLAGLIGLVVGWLGWSPDLPVQGPLSAAVGAAFVGALVGSLVGLVLLVARRRSRPFPFGPSLALGAVIVALAL
jgi:leader peptidase (prepilin peptidase)/N-methyltransferase